MYEMRISHDYLPAFRVIRGENRYDVEAKASAQMAIWNDRWERRQAAETAREQRKDRRSSVLLGKNLAQEQTLELQAKIVSLESILAVGIAQPSPSWESLKSNEHFLEAKPSAPNLLPLPLGPTPSLYEPKLGFMDKLLPSRKAKRVAEAKETFDVAVRSWQEQAAFVQTRNDAMQIQQRDALLAWQERKTYFETTQRDQHAFIERVQQLYLAGEKSAVEYLASEALERTGFPDGISEGHDLSYDPPGKMIVVDFEFPNEDYLPKHRQVKFVASRSELQYVPVSETWKRNTYDSILYQLALRAIHHIFTVDVAATIQSVVFNGWVRSIDRSTGSETHACILSVQAGRDEFLCLDLSRVDAKACFKSLKGMAAAKLAELTPIRPILMVNKEDPRFIQAYNVADEIDSRTNLAAMDWQDFENLIREIFEKEFHKSGGEVMITRASRDGGVDAVAFDPDPVRGGKIIIQAKRYTNTVGVSAVRDLFGTVQHEGAMKGILVTTASFGSDAYEFARDKPLTLIGGGELLGLLDRHGHAAKIDLSEARALRSSR